MLGKVDHGRFRESGPSFGQPNFGFVTTVRVSQHGLLAGPPSGPKPNIRVGGNLLGVRL